MNAEQAAADCRMKPALHLGLCYNYCSILTITNIQSGKNSQCGGSQHQHHSTDDEVITMTTISMTTNIIITNITNITTVKGNSTDKPRHDVTFHQQQQLSLVTTSRNVVQQHWRHAVSLNTPEQHLIAVNPSNVIKSNNECCNVSLTTMLHFHSATLLAGIICKMCCFHL